MDRLKTVRCTLRLHWGGSGVISEKQVRCISPGWTIKFHSGYELKDFKDVTALCEKFGVELPEEYKKFTDTN
jgi:lincosamide nucleotidyltransferase A/C/D/E